METNNEQPIEQHTEKVKEKVKNLKRVEAGKKGAAARWAKRDRLKKESLEQNESKEDIPQITKDTPAVEQITKNNRQSNSKYFIPMGLAVLAVAGLYMFMKKPVKEIQSEASKTQKEEDPFEF